MFVLELLGTVSVRSDAAPVPIAAQQRRPLSLLAILGLSGSRGMSRDRIEAFLWPESTASRARHALDQVVYAIRHALGTDSILATGRELRLNPEFIRADVWAFDDAIRGHQWVAAVDQYKGSLLDGFHCADSRELDAWIDAERARVLHAYQGAIEQLALRSVEAGDHVQGVAWWRRLASADPLSADVAKKLMRALAAAGDRVGAVRHARLYHEIVRQELDMEPDSEVEALASELSHPASIPTVAKVPPQPPTIASSSPFDGSIPRALVEPSPRSTRRLTRSRIAAVSSLALLGLVLIGAITVNSRRNRPGASAAATFRSKSNGALPAARAQYLLALDAWSDGSKTGLDSAVRFFLRATTIDDGYAEAYAGLADAYIMLGYFGYRPREEVFPRAKHAALRSMQLDSALASAHPALAYELAWERDFAGADAEFRKAVALDPTYGRAAASDPVYARAHQWYAILLMILAQEPEATMASHRPAPPNPFSLTVPTIELTFTKWVDAYPALSGFTSNGPGTLGGEILSRIDDGVSTHLIARYEITDPGGTRSFKAVIQGKADNRSGEYELNGIVTWGWMIGAQVRAGFQRVAPCELGKLGVCFEGTIRIQRE